VSAKKKKSLEEIVFLVEDAPEGGFTARALGASIVSEADTLEDLCTRVVDAVKCHFDERERSPALIRLHKDFMELACPRCSRS
jgi:hypothetical protein